ncbi:VOC family protein [Frankia sp. AgB1.9]|uniref:VOC family protein n=1 Tax=unclassified Frankia TaxID=2632575 RepID=UPI00193492C5|nr:MULTISPECIES: VOC family protein [unclassified Frankia]MBL7492636.1 VOC family protein [Frankia sp. AgW1.1]MBL7549339.1 VOC family protein [Frankia sp. AgB1.9]MBL7619194.1 VOC family protein [Frankia sp. AgB1.8]
MSPIEHRLFQQSWPEGEYRFFQQGFLVDDVLAAAASWARVFGVGPFHVMPAFDQHAIYRGTEATITLQVAVAQAGPVQIELIQQHCDRPSVFRDWSRGGTSTFHQLATVTPDYDKKKAHYEGLGYEIVTESLSGRFRVAFVDTVADFGFYTEVVESTPGFLANLGKIARASEAWDGTDPVRLLGPDGRVK